MSKTPEKPTKLWGFMNYIGLFILFYWAILISRVVLGGFIAGLLGSAELAILDSDFAVIYAVLWSGVLIILIAVVNARDAILNAIKKE